MSRQRKKHKRRSSRIYVSVIVLFLVAVMGFQILGLYRKNAAYEAQEAALTAEYEEQVARRDELEAYEAYTKTDEYKENVSRTKLGLVRDNEIIFREK